MVGLPAPVLTNHLMIASEQITACTLWITLPDYQRVVLRRSAGHHMGSEQQCTTRQTGNFCRYCIHHDQLRWYPGHLAFRLLVSCTQLYKSYDHLHYHVSGHGNTLFHHPRVLLAPEPLKGRQAAV